MVNKDNLLLQGYKYNCTSEYINMNGETEEIKRFLSEHFNDNTQIMREYWEFYNFENYFHFAKVIRNDVYQFFVVDFKEEQNNLSKLFSDYFEHLFIQLDVKSAQKLLLQFETDIKQVYDRIRKLKFKIMKRMLK